jgi:hypothetical protein
LDFYFYDLSKVLGRSTIESIAEIHPDKTYRLELARKGHMAELKVNGLRAENRIKSMAFPIGTQMFFGGFPPGMTPRKHVAELKFLEGCIDNVKHFLIQNIKIFYRLSLILQQLI